jgi:hypothetical protein
MPTVLITGANRGLGLEFARQYSADGWEVIATVREQRRARKARVRIETLDMRDLDAVAAFGAQIETLDLLIANAGTYGPKSVESAARRARLGGDLHGQHHCPLPARPVGAPASRPLEGQIDRDQHPHGQHRRQQLGRLHRLSLVEGGAERGLAKPRPRHPLARVVAAVLHPGWVETRMGGPSAPLEPKESIAGMRRVIESSAQTSPAASSATTDRDSVVPARLPERPPPFIGAPLSSLLEQSNAPGHHGLPRPFKNVRRRKCPS